MLSACMAGPRLAVRLRAYLPRHACACPRARRACPALAQTGRSYGERPPLVISPNLCPELDAYIDKWRAFLGPTHGLLFTQ